MRKREVRVRRTRMYECDYDYRGIEDLVFWSWAWRLAHRGSRNEASYEYEYVLVRRTRNVSTSTRIMTITNIYEPRLKVCLCYLCYQELEHLIHHTNRFLWQFLRAKRYEYEWWLIW
jgi:hypothetical protein